MFICDPCLKEHYKNDESFARSHGPCEICKNIRSCNDIHHSQLQPKEHAQQQKTAVS